MATLPVSLSSSGPGPRARPLKVGLVLPTLTGSPPGPTLGWRDHLALARAAEAAGFDSIWVPDELLYRFDDAPAVGWWECWTMLSAVAASTARVELGTFVSCTNYRNPALLAKMAATVDEISGGRLILGLGAGWNEVEFDAFGFPFDHRVARFEEAFTIVRTLLREGAIDFAGTYYQARDCELRPRPRPGGPPLMIGSTGERMLRITVPYVDSWNAWYDATGNRPEEVRPLRETVDAACRAAGRDPATLERTVAVQVRLSRGTGRKHGDPERRATPLAGSAEELAEGLRAYAREGIGHLQLVLDPITEASIAELAPVLELLDRAV